jgi:hypothetical protein
MGITKNFKQYNKMTKEDKELFLKDLSARLPYWVKITWDGKHLLTVTPYVYCAITSENNINKLPKMFLRPMLSMTDEEISDLQKINCQFCFNKFNNSAYVGATNDGFCSVEEMSNILDYLNSHHFDYRGLIEKGLALEAPEGMYNIKEK